MLLLPYGFIEMLLPHDLLTCALFYFRVSGGVVHTHHTIQTYALAGRNPRIMKEIAKKLVFCRLLLPLFQETRVRSYYYSPSTFLKWSSSRK